MFSIEYILHSENILHIVKHNLSVKRLKMLKVFYMFELRMFINDIHMKMRLAKRPFG